MNLKMLGAVAAAVTLIAAIPVAEAASRPKFGDSVEVRDKREHERVRRQQVKQRGKKPVYEPIFSPLYKGHNSPGQRLKRAVH